MLFHQILMKIILKHHYLKKCLPEIISKNLAELKANKVSSKFNDKLVIGADSVIDLEGKIYKATNRMKH